MLKYTVIFIVLQLVLLLPSFYLYKRAVVRFNIKRVKMTSVILTLVMPFIYTSIFVFVCYTIISPIVRSQKFDKSKWVKNVDSRYKMINNLIDSNLLIDKTKHEVIEILGNDFTENCWGESSMCYVAYDPDNYAPLDHYEFIVFFSENGIVKKAEYKLI